MLKCLLRSHVRLFVTHQAPQSVGFSRQESWSGLPFPSAGDLPNPGIELGFPTLQAYSLLSEPLGKPQNIGEYLKSPEEIFVYFILKKQKHLQ